MSRFSQIEEAAEWVLLCQQLKQTELSAPTRFLLETRGLSRMTRMILALVIFDGYEIGGCSDARTGRESPLPRLLPEG